MVDLTRPFRNQPGLKGGALQNIALLGNIQSDVGRLSREFKYHGLSTMKVPAVFLNASPGNCRLKYSRPGESQERILAT